MSRTGRAASRPAAALRRTLRPYASGWTFLSVATLLYWIATQSLRPYMTIHLTSLGASEVTVGAALAAYPFLSLLLAIPAGRFMDVHGLRRMMAISLAAMAVAGLGYAFVARVTPLIVLQPLAGLTELGSWVGIQALITQVEDPALRKAHLALFSVLWALGVAAGPTLGAFAYEAVGFVAVGLVYAACAAGALLAVLGVPHRDAPPESPPERPTWRLRSGEAWQRLVAVLGRPGVGPVLAASFVMLWANNLRVSFYPLFLERAGLPLPTIGYLVSLAGVTLLLARLPLPWLLNRFRSLPVLMLGTAGAVLAVAVTPLIVVWPVALWIAAAVFGLGFGLNSPVTIDVIADSTDAGDRGMAMGMRVASNRLAQVSQPLVFGAVAGALGMPAGFGASAVIMGGTLAWATLRSRNLEPAA